MSETRREHAMVPAEATLENHEVFTAFRKADAESLRISAPDEEPLLVIRDAPQQPEERLSSRQLKQLRSDFEDFQRGHHMPAREAIARLRAHHAL